jgi:branched-chain amino acid transport system permease protein
MSRLTRTLTSRPRTVAWVVVFVAAAVVPLVVSDPYYLLVVATGLAFGLLAVSLDLQWGHGGILNLAPAVSFAVGAYTWGTVASRIEGMSGTVAALLCAAVLPAVLFAVVTFVAFRFGARDIYFALITLALSLALLQGASSAVGLTGGSNGLVGIPAATVGSTELFEPAAMYWFTLVVVAALVVVTSVVLAGRPGRLVAAMRVNDQRFVSFGYGSLSRKVAVSSAAGALGGVAGALYAPLTGIVEPSVFGVALSVQVFVWVAVGGAGSLVGPFVVAVGLTCAQSFLSGGSASAYLLITAVAFMVVVVALPGGLASLPQRWRRTTAVAA